MYKIVITILIIIIGGSYILPASLVEQVPYGTDTQRYTKSAVSWSIATIDDITDGWLTNTFEGLKQKGQEELGNVKDDLKEGVKDAVKDQIDDSIDGVLP